MNKNVVVTGGAGYIGSSLCKELAKSGYNPITIDDLSTGFKKLVKFGDFIEGDFGDYKKLVEVFKKYQPIAVFHIASSKSVAESISNPYKYFDNNVSKTNILLKAVVDCDIENFIFSSSAAIFGNVDIDLVDENYSAKPINPYGLSKLMSEQLIQSYADSSNLKFSCLRYFNVTGADPELEVGEITKTPNNLFPSIIKAIDEEKEFNIYGDDYNTKDGTCIRDYIHVNDLVKAHILALEKQINNNKSSYLNLGNGFGFSVKDVVSVFKKVTKIDFVVRIAQKRLGDSDKTIANNKLITKYLGWKPKYYSLEDQVKHAWKWHQLNKK